MRRFPFEQYKVERNVYIRLFSPDVEDEELIWHWDKEDRAVLVLQSGGWAYEQKGLPHRILRDEEGIFIPKGIWHRVIKGDDDLIVKVKMLR